MHFHSLDYLLFLLITVAGFWLLVRARAPYLGLLLVASCLFYMAWSPRYVLLIFGSAVLDFSVGLALGATDSARSRKALVLLSLCGNLGLLAVFKYFNFFSQALADGMGSLGVQVDAVQLHWLLPVGISFYTFQTLSYTIDVYRRRLEPTRNFVQFAVFVTFFPQLVAGPIVRASELLPQLVKRPKLTSEQVGSGLFLIITGLVKKVAVADFVAVNFVDRVFDEPGAYTAAEVMIGLYGYTLQIYCDFSGYTDIARGSARLMGFSLPENFDRPYQSRSPAEFWRRWHMTLSSWLRDYLYFPLGGSRGSAGRAYFNLFLTMFLIGLWHGADWTFVIYGLIQAFAVVAHRFLNRRAGPPVADQGWARIAAKVFGTMHLVVLSRIFFRAHDMDAAWTVIEQLGTLSLGVGHVTASLWAVLILGYVAHYTPRHWFKALEAWFVRLPVSAQAMVLATVGAGLMMVVSQDVVPYIYFQF